MKGFSKEGKGTVRDDQTVAEGLSHRGREAKPPIVLPASLHTYAGWFLARYAEVATPRPVWRYPLGGLAQQKAHPVRRAYPRRGHNASGRYYRCLMYIGLHA